MKHILMICVVSLMLFGCSGGSSNSQDEANPTVIEPPAAQTSNDTLPSSLKHSYADGVGGGVATSSSYRIMFAFGDPQLASLHRVPVFT